MKERSGHSANFEEHLTYKQQKIGVFGGSFDPVHEGHVRLAEFVLAQGIVDQILFLPAARPPHKIDTIASFAHRIAMLKTVTSGKAEFAVSNLEGKRHGLSYTVDSLRELAREYKNTRLSFLLGADSLIELHLWYHFTEIFHLAPLIVVARSNYDDKSAGRDHGFRPQPQPTMKLTEMSHAPGIFSDKLCYQAIKDLPGNFIPDDQYFLWQRDDGARIYYLKGFSCPISSSNIRAQLHKGLRPRGIDPDVFSYIQKYRLYT